MKYKRFILLATIAVQSYFPAHLNADSPKPQDSETPRIGLATKVDRVAPRYLVDECVALWNRHLPKDSRFQPVEGVLINRQAGLMLLSEGFTSMKATGSELPYKILCALKDEGEKVDHLNTYFLIKMNKNVKTKDGKSTVLSNPVIY